MERLIAWLFAQVIRGCALLSLDGQRRVGRALGSLGWLLNTDGARFTRINIGLCFPELTEAQQRLLAKRSLQQSATLVPEYGMVFHWSKTRWQALATGIEGEDLIIAARERGRGVLILVPHLGNWEFLSLYLGRHSITALYDPPRIRSLEPLIREARSRAGAVLLPIDGAGMRAYYQSLKQGGVAALLPDQVPLREAGLHSPFFGHPALTMTFAHRLIRSTRPVVLLGSALRTAGGFRLRFELADEAIADADPAISAAAMNRAFETMVRRCPEQYQWEYKRFKRPPDGIPNPYRQTPPRAP